MGLKRKTKRDKPLSEGIPIAELGGEFEWIDKRLKLGLEAYPSMKRPLGKAEIGMMLSLGLYFDEISQRWQPLTAIDISTVRNTGRYYVVEPAPLVSDQFNNMRIDASQRELVNEVNIDSFLNGVDIDLENTGVGSDLKDITTNDYNFDSASICLYDLTGINTNLEIDYILPDLTRINVVSYVGVAASQITFEKLISWKSFRIQLFAGGATTNKCRVHLAKLHKYYP